MSHRRSVRDAGPLLALRACWVILRGGSVAVRISFTGGFRSLSDRALVADCELDGRPLTEWDLRWADPESQPE